MDSKYFLISLRISPLTCYLGLCCLKFHLFKDFPNFSPFLISNLVPLLLNHILCMMQFVEALFTIMSYDMVYPEKYSVCLRHAKGHL